MKKIRLYTYDWKYEDIDGGMVIRIYGRTIERKNVCVKLYDFEPYCYFELPDMEWNEDTVNLVINKLNSSIQEKFRPIKRNLVYLKKLYYAHVRKSTEEEFKKTGMKYVDKTYPYILLTFQSLTAQRYYIKRAKTNAVFLGKERIVVIPRENDEYLTPILKLTTLRKIYMTGWIEVVCKDTIEPETLCDIEVDASWKKIKLYNSEEIPVFKELTFDNEANSMDFRRMPDSSIAEDIIFQSSAIVEEGDNKREFLFNVGKISPISGVEIIECDDETDLLMKRNEFIRKEKPNIIIGYNILGWDFKYEHERAKFNCCTQEYLKMSFLRGRSVEMYKSSWDSKAFSKNDIAYPLTEGILLIDVLPIVKRDYKLPSYTLKEVGMRFLGYTKDPVTAREIFQMFATKDPDKLAIIGKYCVQDSRVTRGVYKKLQTLISLIEHSKANNVPIIYLYTKGQQIKIVFQIFKYCTHNSFIFENGIYSTNLTGFQGGYVIDPIVGLHHYVTAPDFSSLYPSIMCSANTDYTKLVKDETISDEDCNVNKISSHKNCNHDSNRKTGKSDVVLCIETTTRFLKAEFAGNGILPILVKSLLTKRKEVKAQQKEVQKNIDKLEKELEIKPDTEKGIQLNQSQVLYIILECRQLALKVTANSMYGATGTISGYLPCLEISFTITEIGRKSINMAKRMSADFNALTIYGDTDSLFIKFPESYTLKQIQDESKKISNRSREIFPDPMLLDYDGKLIRSIIFFTKKRYALITCDTNGKIHMVLKKDGTPSDIPLITKKGIALQRRDNPPVTKMIYENLLVDIFMGVKEDDIIYNLYKNLDKMFNTYYSDKEFVLSKSITKSDLTEEFIKKQYFKATGEVKKGTLDKDEKKIMIAEIKAKDKSAFDGKYLAKQSHIVLADKMRNRGIPVSVGSRIDYLFTTRGDRRSKQEEKIEDFEYYQYNKKALKIDRLYTFEHCLIKPIDQLLEVALGIQGFMKTQYDLRCAKHRVNEVIKGFNKSNIKYRKKLTINFE